MRGWDKVSRTYIDRDTKIEWKREKETETERGKTEKKQR